MLSSPRDQHASWNIDGIQVVLTTSTVSFQRYVCWWLGILEIEWIYCSANSDANVDDIDSDADEDADNDDTGDGDTDDKDDAHGAFKCGAVVVLMQAGAKNFYLLIVSIIISFIVNIIMVRIINININIIINTTINIIIVIIIVLIVTIISVIVIFIALVGGPRLDRRVGLHIVSSTCFWKSSKLNARFSSGRGITGAAW